MGDVCLTAKQRRLVLNWSGAENVRMWSLAAVLTRICDRISITTFHFMYLWQFGGRMQCAGSVQAKIWEASDIYRPWHFRRVLQQFSRSPRTCTRQWALEIGIRRPRIHQLLKRAKWKIYILVCNIPWMEMALISELNLANGFRQRRLKMPSLPPAPFGTMRLHSSWTR